MTRTSRSRGSERPSRAAGFEDVRFEYEPVGAAYFRESALTSTTSSCSSETSAEAPVTSASCASAPRCAKTPAAKRILTPRTAVGLAGDAFDGELVDRAVSPRLGHGTHYRSYLDGKEIPIPVWLYARLRRWHHLSFLRTRETLQLLNELRAQCDDPEPIEALLHLIEMNMGFHLARRVEGARITLSNEDLARITLATARSPSTSPSPEKDSNNQ